MFAAVDGSSAVQRTGPQLRHAARSTGRLASPELDTGLLQSQKEQRQTTYEVARSAFHRSRLLPRLRYARPERCFAPKPPITVGGWRYRAYCPTIGHRRPDMYGTDSTNSTLKCSSYAGWDHDEWHS